MKHLLTWIVLHTLLFSSLQPIPANASNPAVPNLIVWHSLQGVKQAEIQALWNGYAAAHSELTITVVQHDNIGYALDAAAKNGTLPDVVLSSNDILGTQVDHNRLADLGLLGITPTWLSGIYEPPAVQGVQYQSKVWGIPFLEEGIALVYNKDLVTSPYLPTDPLDFSALHDQAQAFQTATGKELICNQGFAAGDAYHLAPVFFGFGLPGYVSEHGQVYFGRSETTAAADWLLSMKALAPGGHSYDGCNSLLLNGDIGMWWTGPWAIAGLESGGLNYGIVAMGRPFVGIQTLMMTTAASMHGVVTEALDLMESTANTANSKSFSLATRAIPANTHALNDPEVQALKSIQGFGAAFHLGIPMSPSPAALCQWDPVAKAETSFWSGTHSIQDAIKIAVGEMVTCELSQGVLKPNLWIPSVRR